MTIQSEEKSMDTSQKSETVWRPRGDSNPRTSQPATTSTETLPRPESERQAGAPEPVIPLQACKHCGTLFERNIHRRLYCTEDCALEAGAERKRLKVKAHYWADPVAARAKQREYFNNHREEHRASMRKSQRVVCTKCGTVRSRGDLTQSERAEFICSDCKTAARRHAICYCCEREFFMAHARQGSVHYCPDCSGLLTRTGEAIGLTRERVRQLVNKRVSMAALMGFHLTRREALRQIVHERTERLRNLQEVARDF